MSSDASVITVCITCRHRPDDEAAPAPDPALTDGERLAALIEAAATGRPAVRVRRHACLMGCAGGCNVAVQGAGKISYVLGRFAPEPAAAEAIVEWAALHAASESGIVPYRSWPVGVKGHFTARIPPLAAGGADGD